MPITAARAKRPSARDDKAHRGASHVERQRKLWSFLTWSFLLAQIAIAEKLFGSSAQAAIENENAADGAALGDEQGENAAHVPDVPVFTGSLGAQAKTDAPDAGNRFQLGKAPAGQELPDLDGSASGDASVSIASTGVSSNISAAVASASSQSDGADGGTPSADPDGPDGPQVGIPDPDLTDPTGSLPDVVDGVTDTVLDLLDTTIALDISLDTSIVTDLLDQLGIDLDLPLDLDVDLVLDLNPAELVGDVADTTLGTVDDVTDLALGTVDDLLAPVTDSPLVASLNDTLNGVPLAGDLVPEDADALFETAFANADALVTGAIDTVDDVADAVQPVVSELADQVGDTLSTLAFTTTDLLNNAADLADDPAAAVADAPIMASLSSMFESASAVTDADAAPGDFDELFDNAFASATTAFASVEIEDDGPQVDGLALDLSAQAGSQLLDLANGEAGDETPLITFDLPDLVTSGSNDDDSPSQTDQPTAQSTDDFSTQDGQQSDFMIALNSSEEDPADAPTTQESFTQSLPLIGDAFHEESDDDDLSGVGIIDETVDSTTSLIDDPSPTNGWGLGLWG